MLFIICGQLKNDRVFVFVGDKRRIMRRSKNSAELSLPYNSRFVNRKNGDKRRGLLHYLRSVLYGYAV